MSAGAIRAGRAFVSLEADDAGLRAGLNQGAKRLEQFSAKAASVTAGVGEGFNKLANIAGQSGFGGEFTSALSLASNAAFGLQGALITLGAVGAKALFEVVSGINDLNKELEKGKELSDKVAQSLARIRGKELEGALANPDADERITQLREIEKKRGLEKSGKESEKQALEALIAAATRDVPFFDHDGTGKKIVEERAAARERLLKEFGSVPVFDTGIDAAREKVKDLQKEVDAATAEWQKASTAVKEAERAIADAEEAARQLPTAGIEEAAKQAADFQKMMEESRKAAEQLAPSMQPLLAVLNQTVPAAQMLANTIRQLGEVEMPRAPGFSDPEFQKRMMDAGHEAQQTVKGQFGGSGLREVAGVGDKVNQKQLKELTEANRKFNKMIKVLEIISRVRGAAIH